MEFGRIIAVCTSTKKGTSKTNVHRGIFKENHGLVGDAHAGSDKRQVSLFSQEDLEALRKDVAAFACGDFAENLTTAGICLSTLTIGVRLKIGKVILEVTQIGKDCTTPCRIYEKHGYCALPSKGIFARVVAGGEVREGDVITRFDGSINA